jgi:hypothetical protein
MASLCLKHVIGLAAYYKTTPHFGSLYYMYDGGSHANPLLRGVLRLRSQPRANTRQNESVS